jgi:hypothetical protein
MIISNSAGIKNSDKTNKQGNNAKNGKNLLLNQVGYVGFFPNVCECMDLLFLNTAAYLFRARTTKSARDSHC